MSKDYVVRLYFNDGTHEQVKYEDGDTANEAYESIAEHFKDDEGAGPRDKVGELELPDGTRFAFKASCLSHWKIFKYTTPDKYDSRDK